jgi:hypothetical protein
MFGHVRLNLKHHMQFFRNKIKWLMLALFAVAAVAGSALYLKAKPGTPPVITPTPAPQTQGPTITWSVSALSQTMFPEQVRPRQSLFEATKI